MTINPQLENVVPGDVFVSFNSATLQYGFSYEATVIRADTIMKRFGCDDRILTVCVHSVNLETGAKTVVDYEKLIWHSVLSKGLV